MGRNVKSSDFTASANRGTTALHTFHRSRGRARTHWSVELRLGALRRLQRCDDRRPCVVRDWAAARHSVAGALQRGGHLIFNFRIRAIEMNGSGAIY